MNLGFKSCVVNICGNRWWISFHLIVLRFTLEFLLVFLSDLSFLFHNLYIFLQVVIVNQVLKRWAIVFGAIYRLFIMVLYFRLLIIVIVNHLILKNLHVFHALLIVLSCLWYVLLELRVRWGQPWIKIDRWKLGVCALVNSFISIRLYLIIC